MNSHFYASQFPILEIDDKYILREQEVSDSADFFKYYADPKVGQHILATKPSNQHEASQEIQFCRDLFYRRSGIYWALADKASNKMIGAVGIYINPTHQRGEICYDLAHSHWNRGIMTNALRVVIDFSFKIIGLMRLEATILPENKASDVILQKLGFIHEGTLRKYRYYRNKFYDVEMLSLLAPQQAPLAALIKKTIHS